MSDNKQKISSLRAQLQDKDLTPTKRRELRRELVNLIKEEKIVKLENGDPFEFHITYDTFGQTLEPIYFWVLDFLRNDSPSGLGFEVDKVEEEFEASVGGGYFGDVGTKASVMQDRAMKILETINAVLRTIINLIYDLREYDMRLEIYDDAKSSDKQKKQAAEYSLKGIWMDQVDIKTGIGSINNLTRGDLQFVTLRDAFMQTDSLKQVDKLDLNKRVKVLLKKKLTEYLKWRESSEQELRKRYSIEKNYLKSQVDALRLYTKWARPYLRAAQKLGMKEFRTKSGLPSPDIVATFNNTMMELKLLAKQKIDPKDVHESYENLNFKEDYYSCLEVEFQFRTAPQVARAGQSTHFAHMGVVDIWFRAYSFTDKDIKDIQQLEVYEDMDLVEELTETSLKDLQADIDHYLEPEKKQEEQPTKQNNLEFPNPLKGLKELFAPVGDYLMGKKEASPYHIEKIQKEAKNTARDRLITLYDIFKKSHRMLTW